MLKKLPLLLLLISFCSFSDVEEARLDKAQAAMPNLLNPFSELLNQIKAGVTAAQLESIAQQGFKAGKQVALKQADDRPLYWFRLAAKAKIRQLPIVASEKESLLQRFERTSRGIEEVSFGATPKRILVTGFDPFFLDRHVNQSNPSGLAALQLDGKVLKLNDGNARIEAVLIPVRFVDFDEGMIEALVQPYLRANSIDMLVTISMGRTDFDLERFPGLRRSAKAPDNLNVYTGASAQNPLVPPLHQGPLYGPEFVEFSLPVKAMQKAQGPFKIIDNPAIETLEGKQSATSLGSLAGQTSVQGSGGGYLSNEISYRTIRLRNMFNSKLPVGHIHTPRVKAYDKEEEQQIVKQIEAMLLQAAKTL